MSSLGSHLKDGWWPEIPDLEKARKVARQGFWAAIIVVSVTVVFAALAAFGTSLAGIGPAAFLDAAIFGVIAVGIWRMSRAAALAGLVLFGLERAWMFQESQKPGNLFITVALLFAFANGVRGTFAYHKLREAERSSTDTAPVGPR